MSSPVSSLSAGVQTLYNKGLLPSNVNTSVLSGSTPTQLNQLVGSSVELQEVGTLLGTSSSSSSSSSTDSATLSSTATDALTEAVNNELTANLTAAANKFLPQSTSSSGSQINLLA